MQEALTTQAGRPPTCRYGKRRAIISPGSTASSTTTPCTTSRPARRSARTAPSPARLPAPKLLVGAPLAANAANPEAFLPVDQFASQVIAPLRQQFPGAFGGVTGWAFIDDQGSDWPDGVGLALHQQHMFYWAATATCTTSTRIPPPEINTDQWTDDAQVVSNLATLLAAAQRRTRAARVLRGHRRRRAPRLLGPHRQEDQHRPVDLRRPAGGELATLLAAATAPAARVLPHPLQIVPKDGGRSTRRDPLTRPLHTSTARWRGASAWPKDHATAARSG